jgi:soluble lytic murein transglycosylase-like protein
MRHFILCLHNPGRLTTGLLCGLLLQGLAAAATMERPDDEMRRTLIQAVNSTDSFADRFAAEVWLTDMVSRLGTRVDDPGEAVTILKTAHYEALRARIQPELVLAIMDVESNFDHYAISSAGAQGLMQIMPFWLEEIGKPDDNLMDIGTNLRFGCTILGIYLKREGGNMRRALARYNGSVGEHWYPNRVFNALRKRWYPQ